ncbi:MAG: hypothetical protein CBD51_007475, partial [Flavobacteriales bacterium TMED191]
MNVRAVFVVDHNLVLICNPFKREFVLMKYIYLLFFLLCSIVGISQTVTGVSSTAANGSYKQGDVIPITVEFSEVVNVTGTPQINLKTSDNGTNVGNAGVSIWTGSTKIF